MALFFLSKRCDRKLNQVLYKSKQFILGKCWCGCNEDTPVLYRQGGSIIGRLYRYKQSHNRRGISQNKGENNGQWKGDKVTIGSALHRWVRANLPQPELCQGCNKNKSYDLANKTGIYNRDFENWFYLCRRCHMLSDGRMNNLMYYNVVVED